MGVMEQILEQLQKLNEKIDALPAAGERGSAVLIDGKAALNVKEASKLTGVGEENLKEMARVGRVPHFMNGSHYKFPIKSLLAWMETEAYKNMEKGKARNDFDIMRLTG